MARLATVAAAILTALQDALDADERTVGALATDDDAAARTAALGAGAVLLTWPVIDFGGTLTGDWVSTWQLRVAIRPAPSLAQALDRLQVLLEVIEDALGVDVAEPATFPDPAGETPLAGYLVTLNPINA